MMLFAMGQQPGQLPQWHSLQYGSAGFTFSHGPFYELYVPIRDFYTGDVAIAKAATTCIEIAGQQIGKVGLYIIVCLFSPGYFVVEQPQLLMVAIGGSHLPLQQQAFQMR